ncbi:MAG: GNAT family acetyltransferase [Planctomycetales bacterium]|nr:GNAT family acetyltransferase [Planctomycetales bacterium]
MHIRSYHENDLDAVTSLWREVFGYQTPHNEPTLSIARKLAVADDLFFVADEAAPPPVDGAVRANVIGTVMGGYDGHRGWVYALAVAPAVRGRGIGTALMRHLEARLLQLDCLKINLQVMPGNEQVTEFYRRLGYQVEPRTSMGKCLY